MLVIFGIAVWVPACIAAPGDRFAWSENVETFAIAAAGWIVADAIRLYAVKTSRGFAE